MRLLIVDDNARMRRFIGSLLSSVLTEAREAADGLEAVRLYEQYRPDAVLMDIRMPLLDGIEAARRIRRFDPVARVIIVTDFDTPEYREQAETAGAVAFVAKENMSELPGVLRTIFF